MKTFEEFEQHLRDALTHLYDPSYRPPDFLWTVTGADPEQGVEAVQAAIIQAVEALKPASNVPPNARIRRLYQVLFYRYVQELTQEETARHLGITPRHLRREQQQVVHLLAQRLWEQRRVRELLVDDRVQNTIQSPAAIEPEAGSTAWRSQVRQELESLQQNAPGTVADVAATMHGMVKLGSALTSRHGVSLEMKSVQPDLTVSIHPSALRQILITAIEKLVQHMSSGQITLRAERVAERVKITITGDPATTGKPLESDLIWEILMRQEGSIEVKVEGSQISFQVELLSADKVTVLVVDDNAELVNFYQHYTTDTRYQIVHLAEGKRLFETIAAVTPDIIVLDVLLPDVDGWELLTYLHEHPDTQATPVIVCSVVRREELALALGAALYLSKPVRRQHFIQALDRALAQARARASRVEANSAASG
jgi:CheY-like chemotaxis protein